MGKLFYQLKIFNIKLVKNKKMCDDSWHLIWVTCERKSEQ